jgi:hypothetical protein
MKKKIRNSLIELHNFCKSENYMGYSLYDSHNSPIPFNRLGHPWSFLINQIIKRSPINIRKFIGIKKAFNPKGMGLFLRAYNELNECDNILSKPDIDERCLYFFNWINENYSRGYQGKGWGYHYDWPKSDRSFVPKDTPNSVVTAFNTRAVFNYYLTSGDKDAYNLIIEAKNFIINNTYKFESQEGICFSYTPLKKDITINASLLAAEVLAYSDLIQGKAEYQSVIKSVLDFTIAHQNDDGSWYYSFNVDTKKPKKQIDFHQGYVLDSFHILCSNSTVDFENYKTNVMSGLDFYYSNQFSENGQSLWRYPGKWPTDIHNQSQGIITFSNFGYLDKKYLDFSKKIAIWTVDNMQENNGGFYYQKWKLFNNKVSYMRWNNAWMMVALTTLLNKVEE